MSSSGVPAQPTRRRWTREELLVVLDLYCRLPFGQMHSRNPEIVIVAQAIARTSGAVAMKLVNLASLDPGLRGRGISGLRNVSTGDRAIWAEMNSDWTAFVGESTVALRNYGLLEDTDTTTATESEDEEDRVTERQGIVTLRKGQDFFRETLLSAYNYRCCVSGLAVEELLVASHIVPWRDDTKNRLNPRNGLLLSALHDKAFDRGFITLDDDLVVRVSKSHAPSEDIFFIRSIGTYEGQAISPPEKFRPHPEFLAYHRENIFLG